MLLGENWTGSGDYVLLSASSAYSAGGDFTVYAARIDAPGAEGLCLFWRADGTSLDGGGLIIGDTVTRKFSVWGSAASAGSPADDRVRDAKRSPAGRAVIAAAGC